MHLDRGYSAVWFFIELVQHLLMTMRLFLGVAYTSCSIIFSYFEVDCRRTGFFKRRVLNHPFRLFLYQITMKIG